MDFRAFGKLPRAGGTFDQPAGLLEEMRTVDSIVRSAERAREKRARQEADRQARRRR